MATASIGLQIFVLMGSNVTQTDTSIVHQQRQKPHAAIIIISSSSSSGVEMPLSLM